MYLPCSGYYLLSRNQGATCYIVARESIIFVFIAYGRQAYSPRLSLAVETLRHEYLLLLAQYRYFGPSAEWITTKMCPSHTDMLRGAKVALLSWNFVYKYSNATLRTKGVH